MTNAGQQNLDVGVRVDNMFTTHEFDEDEKTHKLIYFEGHTLPMDKMGYDVCEQDCIIQDMEGCLDCPIASYDYNPYAECTMHRV